MSSLASRANAVLALTAFADYSADQGKSVTISGSTAIRSNSATVPASAIILEEAPTGGTVTVAILGAFKGTVLAKLSGTVTGGARMQQAANGTWLTDAASGGRVVSLIALESGVSGDLIEAAPLTPLVLA